MLYKDTLNLYNKTKSSLEQFAHRFQHFEKAYFLLKEVSGKPIDSLSILEREGVVQRFEILMELSWKVMRDYLVKEGVKVNHSPADTIRHAFQNKIIGDVATAEKWMDAVENRNKSSHTYDVEILSDIFHFATTEFLPLVKNVHSYLKKQL